MRPLLIIVAALSAASSVAAPERSATDTQAQLSRIEARIRSVTEAVQADVAQRDAVASDLRRADEALKAARQRFEEARGNHAASEARLSAVRQEVSDVESRSQVAREALAAQLRAAYIAGPGGVDPLPDPSDLGTDQRLREYAARFSHARAAQMAGLAARTHDLGSVQTSVAAATERLAGVETDRQRQAQALEAARQARAHALTQLQARITDRGVELKELKRNAAALEDLLKRLQAALSEPGGDDFAAVSGHRPFAELRGKLSWPAHGAVVARFGEARAGGLLWNGLLLDTHRGAEVHAVAAGRVAYADWLPGLGLLVILDHGGGWMTLYGYNGRLLRQVGDRVRPGEALAESSASADAGKPQLYFEIREAARAVDPARFLKGTPTP